MLVVRSLMSNNRLYKFGKNFSKSLAIELHQLISGLYKDKMWFITHLVQSFGVACRIWCLQCLWHPGRLYVRWFPRCFLGDHQMSHEIGHQSEVWHPQVLVHRLILHMWSFQRPHLCLVHLKLFLSATFYFLDIADLCPVVDASTLEKLLRCLCPPWRFLISPDSTAMLAWQQSVAPT